jgi:UDP-N-acetylglucosamine--N-acetylmuramyl-(pentapeptide) pyrophosphoryl-undecaprenol N-acetylglucosamine transferase
MNILVAAGGTGGDLFPAVAVIEQLQKQVGSNLSVVFVGNPDRIEARVVPELGYRFEPIAVTGFQGFFHRTTPILPVRIFRSIAKVRSLCRKYSIDVILCGGTYISFPAGIVARQLGIPMMLLEPNVFPGKTNRLLAKRATSIILAFEQSKRYFPKELHGRMFSVGNPVRESMLLSLPDQTTARQQFGLQPDKPTVFLFGGSLGARSLNLAIEHSLEQFTQHYIQLLWQTGKNYSPPQNLPDGIIVRTFIEDMASAYSVADLVVCRSGGGTVAELANVGKPSILVPLPSAANNEQFYNAQTLQEHGAAQMIMNENIEQSLFGRIVDLLHNPALLQRMSDAAKQLAKPNAAAQAAIELLRIAPKNS